MVNQIEQVLSELHRMTEAECVLLADITGQLISLQGQVEKSDPVLLAALAAGDVAAMSELSRRIGETDSSGTFLHEGKNKCIYTFNVGGSFILIVIFRSETPVGMVRLFASRAAEKFEVMIEKFESHVHPPPDDAPAADFEAALSDELEKAFGQA